MTKFTVYLSSYVDPLEVVSKKGASNKAADFFSHLSSDIVKTVSATDEDFLLTIARMSAKLLMQIISEMLLCMT